MALRVAGSSPVIHPTFSALCRGRLRAAQRISQKAGAFFMCRLLRLLYLSACCAFLRFSCFAGFFCFFMRSSPGSSPSSPFIAFPPCFLRFQAEACLLCPACAFNRGSFAFCAPFCSVRLSSFLSAFFDCAFSFSLSWLSPPLPPAPPARPFAVFPPWERTMPNRFYRGVAQLVERVVWELRLARQASS